MGKGKRNKEQKTDKLRAAEQEEVKAKEKTRNRKPFLARFYDKLMPGEYTKEQDRNHALALFAVIVVVLAVVGVSWWMVTESQKDSVSSKLLIPSTAYSAGQLDNVVESLTSQGFKNIGVEEDGDVVAYGRESMVRDYKMSYKEKHVDPAAKNLTNDYSNLGVAKIDLTEDRKTMTIYTYTQDPLDPDIMAPIMRDSGIADLISKYGIWCRMINDGEPMEIVFKDYLREETYYTSQRQSADMIVADLEKERNQKEREAASNNEGPEKQEAGSGQEDAAE